MSAATLFDDLPAVPVHRHARDTERAAAKRIAPVVGTLRWKTLQWVVESGDAGLTAAEGGARYARERGKPDTDGTCRNSIGPRLTELLADGYIADSDIRRGGFIAWVRTGKAIEEATQ